MDTIKNLKNFRCMKGKVFYFIFNVFFPLFVGVAIYVLFRGDTILFTKWVARMSYGTSFLTLFPYQIFDRSYVPDFFIYNFPDGIWVYASVSMISVVWGFKIGRESIIWLCSPFLVALFWELLQFWGLIEGTFDYYDIITYTGSFLMALSILWYFGNRQNRHFSLMTMATDGQ